METTMSDRWAAFNSAIAALDRVCLLGGPTPLERAECLSRELGIELYFKRDDLTGIGAGGNKLRKLEFILGVALKEGATCLITTGGPQSNHARLTAAVAARHGLRCFLRLKGSAPAILGGNLLLDRLFGADVEFLGDLPYAEIDARMAELAAALKRQGERPVVVPLGGATAEGTLGYALAFREILEQAQRVFGVPKYLVLAAGTGSTHAGLLVGARLSGVTTRIIGVSVSWSRDMLMSEIQRHCGSAVERLGLAVEFDAADIHVDPAYVGPGYAQPSELGKKALLKVARSEGVLLDSTYTAKAMSGLIDLVEKGAIEEGSSVIFVHTGGLPELYTRGVQDIAG